MMTHALVNEFAKMRRRRAGVVAVALMVAVLALTFFSIASGPGLRPGSPTAWNAVLAGLSFSMPMAAPLLLAVLASRQTDIEHDGGGWLLHATSGIPPGAVCRAKVIASGLVVAVATLGVSALAAVVGRTLVGIDAPFPAAHWAGVTVCSLIVNLVVLALHVMLSALVGNQLVGLGIGVLGTLVALFSAGFPAALAHLTPWGYYSLIRAADYRGKEIVALPLAYPSSAALAVAALVVLAVVTARCDRKEV